MKKITYITLAAAMFMASCSNDSEENRVSNGPVAAQVTAGVNNPATRANGNVWEADEIGVMAVSVSGTPTTVTSTVTSLYKNVHYKTAATTSDAASFTAMTPDGSATGAAYGIFFQDATETVTFAAYAPYQQSADANVLPGSEGVISQSTASQATRDEQKTIDFIFANGATASKTAPGIQFSDAKAFTHVMSRLVIKVQTSANDGFSAGEVTSGAYSLTGVTHDGTFDVNPASATFGKATAAAAGLPSAWSLNSYAIQTQGNNTVTFDAILFPQTAGNLDFEAVIGGQSYKCQIAPALEAGKSYTYTITAKKQSLTVEGCKVNDWVIGTTENNGEADAR